ncbi:hypothetical protein, partial [Dysosmobacter sp.]|uniref:hypothetical protein n=1 Tax=Dysosmobacter sp. TaxID=2591382 RepID=UPI003FD8BDEE
ISCRTVADAASSDHSTGSYVRDLLYDALRDADTSVEAFEESVSSENVYQHCGITRTAKPRGRPPKKKAGEQA